MMKTETNSTLEPATKWENFTFDDLSELAEDDEVTVKNENELLSYLEGRGDNYISVLGNGEYIVLFG